jgi:hypothetical protein
MNDTVGTELVAAINRIIPTCVPESGRAQFVQGYLENVLNVTLARHPEAAEFIRKTYIEQ